MFQTTVGDLFSHVWLEERAQTDDLVLFLMCKLYIYHKPLTIENFISKLEWQKKALSLRL